MSAETLEERFQKLEDQVDIRALYDCYVDGLTGHDWDAVASCYHEDGIFEELAPVHVKWVGRAEITRKCSELVQSMQGLVMMIHSCVIDLSAIDGPGTARAKAIFHEEGKMPNGIQFTMYGRYCDCLKKNDGKWKFTTRVSKAIIWNLPETFLDDLESGVGAKA